jgi:hypothetical protein
MGKDKKEKDNEKAVTEEEYEDNVKKRETWSNKFDFLLACTGFSVGLGNVWRFRFILQMYFALNLLHMLA